MAVGQFVSVSEAARDYGVTPQRMHQLMKTFGVKPDKASSRFFVIRKSELKKIPKERPTGIHRKKE